MSGSDYDGQDEAYANLLETVEALEDMKKRLEAKVTELKEERKNFALFRDKVAIPALQHAHKQLNERDGDDPTIVWVVDLTKEDDYRFQNAEYFHNEEEARRFKDAISDPLVDYDGWVAINCYEIKKSNISKSAYHALEKHHNDE